MKMSIDDFKTVLSEFRSSEEKKNLYAATTATGQEMICSALRIISAKAY